MTVARYIPAYSPVAVARPESVMCHTGKSESACSYEMSTSVPTDGTEAAADASDGLAHADSEAWTSGTSTSNRFSINGSTLSTTVARYVPPNPGAIATSAP